MSGDGEDNDLTRLEDLSEFLHEDDPEVDGQLETGPPEVPSSLEEEDANGASEQNFSEMPFPSEESTDDAFSEIESEEDASAEVSSDFFDEATNPDIDASSLDALQENDSTDDSDTFGSDSDSFESSDSTAEITMAEDDDYATDSFDSGDFNQELETADMSDLTSDGFDAPADDTFGDDNDETSFGDDSDTQADFGSDDSFGVDSDDQIESDDNFESSEDFSSLEQDDQDENGASEPLDPMPDTSEPDTSEPTTSFTTEPLPEAPEPTKNENFNDIKDFGNSISYGVVSHGGNPPFSLILRDIKFNDDVDDIIIILKEHGLCPDEEEDNLRKMMESGSLLISQISEYSAIFLAHKMRRFDCNILVGLSDQLHPSKSYENESRGLVSKYNLKQNVSEEITLKEKSIDIDSIFAVTTPTVSGHQIIKYLDLLTAHTVVEESDLRSMKSSSKSLDEQSEEEFLDALLEQTSTDSDEKYQFDINDTYKELIVELQSQAYKIEANAIVGINFQLSPLVHQEADDTNTILYKITATGNGVIVDEV
ncbi:MAG: heavy metal-binding domain-containing protein [Oligoflexia bacterium]|nr:heavy metal-binding domain-containing protein [Oligoflexia bacterium]